MSARTCSLLPALLLLACRTSAPAEPPAANPSQPPPAADAKTFGVLAPHGGTAVSLWPETYEGGWLLLEVVPHGTEVAAGDVIARFDTRSIDEQLRRGELELGTAELDHQALQERNRLEAAADEAALARSRAGLERARRALEGWKQVELAFEERQEGVNQSYREANLEDQNDELAQLEQMYSSDELVDATEEIVLKRSRRSLAITETQNALSSERAEHHRQLDVVLQTEQREEEFKAQGQALEQLTRQQALAAGKRADTELRSTAALAEQSEKFARLKRDRALFELRAPSAGLLLHGAERDYRPGMTPPRLERGAGLAPRTDLFVVAPPEPGSVTFDVADTERERFASGKTLAVHALAGAEQTTAQIELEGYPRTLSASETQLRGSAVLTAPLPGARYGERVRLELEK